MKPRIIELPKVSTRLIHCRSNKLSLNFSKTIHIHFRSNNALINNFNCIHISIDAIIIENKESTQILGTTIDRRDPIRDFLFVKRIKADF